MAITVKYLTELGIEKDTAEKIFAERGAEIEREKAKLAGVEAELEESKKAYETLTAEMDNLKSSNATAADYKAKYEAIVAENDAKQKQAEAEKIAKEKAESIERRFSAAEGDKHFRHPAIREAYLKKFTDALEDEKYQSLSDADLLHELTKEDKDAYEGVTVVRLAGAANNGVMPTSKYQSRDEIINIKDAGARQKEMLARPDLFPEIRG